MAEIPVSHQPTTPQTSLAGVGTVAAVQTAWSNAQLCAAGWHAWVPWLQMENGSFVTWCAREGCDHGEQFDV